MSLRYQIALTSVSFDNTYQNVIRFNSREEQAEYFGLSSLFCKNAIDNGECVNVNFDAGSLIRTSIFFISQENTAAGLLGKNYAIIRDTQEGAPEYYYYFITDSRLNSSKQIQLDIELDIYQTYYQDITFGDCFINKAHINRFKSDNDNIVFDSTPDSLLFETEDIGNLAKRLVERGYLRLLGEQIEGDSSFPVNYAPNHIAAWLYVFLKRGDGYKFRKLGSIEEEMTLNDSFSYSWNGQTFDSGFNVLAFPIIVDGALRAQSSTQMREISTDGIHGFIGQNGTADILAIKISQLPPYPYAQRWDSDTTGVEISGSDNEIATIINKSTNTDYIAPFGNSFYIVGCGNWAGLYVRQQRLSDVWDTSTIDLSSRFPMSFAKGGIIGSDHNSQYNPKLLNSDFNTIVIKIGTNTFTYDIQKLGRTDLKFMYSEFITPDVTRAYLRYFDNRVEGEAIYLPISAQSLDGLVAANDFSMPFSVNQLDTYLANNKNFFQQRQIQLDYAEKGARLKFKQGLRDTASTGLTSYATSNPVMQAVIKSNNALQMYRTGKTAIENYNYSIEGIENELILSNLTLDNMRGAPETFQNANGNVFLNFSVSMCMATYEIYSSLSKEIKMCDNQMNLYGFAYHQLDNIKNVDNIRKYFNYVSAELQTLQCTYGLSNEVMQMYRAIFSRGVRMWNNTDQLFKYEKENYENWLDEA